MELIEVRELLESIQGFKNKVAYREFPKGKAPKLPFICYMATGTSNFKADNKVYCKITDVDIELYTKYKSQEVEAKIEEALDNKNIVWDKVEDYIEKEECYMITYGISI